MVRGSSHHAHTVRHAKVCEVCIVSAEQREGLK